MPTATTASRAPSEIADVIIDYLHSDRGALAACGLVCKAWIPASRYHLFMRIRVRARKAVIFFEILNAPLCTFRPYVIYVVMPEIRLYPASLLDDIEMFSLPTFKAAKSVHLSDFDWPLGEGLRTLLFSAFREIKSLTVNSSAFSRLFDLTDLIKAFTLERLTLYHNFYGHEGPFIPDTMSPTGQIVTSIFEGISSLNSFHLLSMTSSEVPSLAQLLREIGPSLNHLYLRGPSFLRSSAEDVCHAIDLAHNVNLRSLHLIDISLDRIGNFRTMSDVQWMVLIISQIKSLQMEELKIEIFLEIIHDLNRVDWKALAVLFAQPNFSRLKQICFSISADEGVDPKLGEELIKLKLPACDARGILSFL